MVKTIVDKKNNKVSVEMSIEQAFGVLAGLSFLKTMVDYNVYDSMFRELDCPQFEFNPSGNEVDSAIKEQKELVAKFNKITFNDVKPGHLFSIKNSKDGKRYIKSHYPNDNHNCYFISDGTLIHAMVCSNSEVEVFGGTKFSITLQ